MHNNPYPTQSLLGKIFDLLKIKERPITVTNVAVALGSTYAAVYRAVYNDKIKVVQSDHIDGVLHVKLTDTHKKQEPTVSINETIQDVMVSDKSEHGLHVHQIAQKSHATQPEVKLFIKEQNGLGNIEVHPTQGKHGHRYRWAGPVSSGIKEEMLRLAKEVEAESIDEAKLEPNADELEQAKEPEPIKTFEPTKVIKPLPAIKEPEMTQPTPTVTPKVRYLIQAAKDKMATANSEKSAKQIAKRFVNEGHKRVEISTIYPYAVAKSGIEVERVW
ncbi:hypothetical protein ACBP93_08390 [Paenalcaligenes hominis]|uniref:Uncharacterized protein n=1 Tax=Paenalcaligenes hominis TaxID=643674 RepID=A0A1U9JYF6_9BURK|nr:hypothetical protein [Paenalcaligenes hominis]AQS50759.1 hypothetical protein PAEH1_02840 [Paenalcaligenes hominis]